MKKTGPFRTGISSGFRGEEFSFFFFKPFKRSKFYHVNLNNLCMSHAYKTPDQFIQNDSRDEIWIWNVLNQNGKKSACKLAHCLYCQGQVPTRFSAHDVNQKYWAMFSDTNSIASQHSILFMCQANKKTLLLTLKAQPYLY